MMSSERILVLSDRERRALLKAVRTINKNEDTAGCLMYSGAFSELDGGNVVPLANKLEGETTDNPSLAAKLDLEEAELLRSKQEEKGALLESLGPSAPVFASHLPQESKRRYLVRATARVGIDCVVEATDETQAESLALVELDPKPDWHLEENHVFEELQIIEVEPVATPEQSQQPAERMEIPTEIFVEILDQTAMATMAAFVGSLPTLSDGDPLLLSRVAKLAYRAADALGCERAARQTIAEATGANPLEDRALELVFSGPPGPATSTLFIEAEVGGRSVKCGEWAPRPDGTWVLKITRHSLLAALKGEV